MSEKPRNKEVMTVEHPTFFLCAGVSGAGCTTAIRQANIDGLTELGPAQYATRSLRPTETRGLQYYPVTHTVLEKIPKQIAIEDSMYGNRYGFFLPAIEKIRKTLNANKNVILDAANKPDEWRELLGVEYKISTIFFAPQDQIEAVKRIQLRAQQGGQVLLPEDIELRKVANSKSIERVVDFDYWLDTSDLTQVLPALKSIIETESMGIHSDSPNLLCVVDN